MTLLQFVDFNQNCPLCNEPLTLYMQWVNSICFRASLIEKNHYRFDLFACFNKDIEDSELLDNYMNLMFYDNPQQSGSFNFSSAKLFNLSKKHHIYFFYMCNSQGFKITQANRDYQILLYKACYYRSSIFMELKELEKHWRMLPLTKEFENVVNKNETFTFKSRSSDLEKVYILNLDNEEKETTLWYYTITEEQRKNNGPHSNVFEKKLPLLSKRPNFKNKQAMIDRLDSWIIMS